MADRLGGPDYERSPRQRRSVGASSAGPALCLIIFAAALLGPALPQAAAAGGLGFSFTPSKTEPYAVCGRPTPGHSACAAILVPTASARSLSASPQTASPTLATPTFTGSGVGGGYAPADLRSAYGLPSESAGSGQTVAIVDAFDDPKAESDLGVYRSRYGIPACTTANGCFKKVNQKGEAKYPAAEPGWAVEISLDIDMVSAACPNCHILLVEATNSTNENLYKAEDEAAALGATEISNSYEGAESSNETSSSDPHFHHAGVAIFASAGDSGYGVRYPAASQYVTAVGGTALKQASNSRGWSETVWKGTGSGCSAYEPKPAWQTASPGCTKRTNNDIAAVASPETPVSIADSYELPSEFSKPEPGWTLTGGTSVSSPLMAGAMALANAYTRSFGGTDAYYLEASQNGTGTLTDVTSGSNGSCGTYLCNGEVGYDGPTGLGTPYGAPLVLPSPPTVVTKAASSVAQTTATLNATVNPNGGEVGKCEFEYGTTTAYGSTAPCASLPGSGESAVAVSASIAGLAANTIYHFRIQATNAGGTSKGSDEMLKTTAGPPTVETKAASSITQTTATLNASVNPNGGEVSECRLEYGPSNAYGSSATCTPTPGSGSSPVAVSAAIAGLSANTTYHFRISATNTSGTSKGADQEFNTLASAPTVVTKAASSLAQTSATLNATVNPNGGEVTKCEFEYGTTTSYGQSAPCSSLPGSGSSPVAVSASVTGLTTNTTYHFRIQATNASGTSKGLDETFTTLAPALTPHYFSNGVRLGESEGNSEEEGVRVGISWGTLELKGESGAAAGGTVTCHTVAAGLDYNPIGGGAGKGNTETFAAFACQSNICKAGEATGVVPASLPWPSELTGTSTATFRSKTGTAAHPIRVSVTCNATATAPFEGEDQPLAPSGLRKGNSSKAPGQIEFDSGSGELKLVSGFGGATLGTSRTIGSLKTLGFENEEPIQIDPVGVE